MFGIDKDIFGNTRPVIGRDGLIPSELWEGSLYILEEFTANRGQQRDPGFINRPPISQQTARRRQPDPNPFLAASLQRQLTQQQAPQRQPTQQQAQQRLQQRLQQQRAQLRAPDRVIDWGTRSSFAMPQH